MLSPDCIILVPTAEVCPGASSERAEDASYLASSDMEIESDGSHNDKAFEELLEMVTCSVQAEIRLATGARDQTQIFIYLSLVFYLTHEINLIPLEYLCPQRQLI